MSILNVTNKLETLLNIVNDLPNSTSELPQLTKPANASQLLNEQQLIDAYGKVVTGTMPNNGTINTTFDGINTKSYTIPKGYADGGTISLDNTIDNEVDVQSALIDQISEMLEGKASGGGSSTPTNPSASTKTVNFCDYDGTVLYSYTKDEALSLTSLPPLPSHQGLICQGWNWSLTDIKSYVVDCGQLEIGAMYITDDGKTRIYITLQEGRTSPMLGVCPNGTVTVDWGDGSIPDTLTGTSTSTVQWTPTHNYSSAGDYVITLSVDGSMGFYGASNQLSGILRFSSSSNNTNYGYVYAVKKIEIGNGVESISNYAFYNCSALVNITIPNNITSIGIYAFGYCYSLISITIPNSVTNIDNYAFSDCKLITSIIIPNDVSLGTKGVFQDCYSLANIMIPDNIVTIGRWMFYYCKSLTNINIPNGVTEIDNSAFDACDSLANIIIPDSVTSIGNYTFQGCDSLLNIVIPSSIQTIGDYAFSGCNFTSIEIPDSVTRIGNNAFSGCSYLTNIIIPNSVTNIGGNAFSNCKFLTNVTIPNGVTSIGDYTFRDCSSLTSIDIPSSVTSIGKYALHSCYSLAKLRFNSTTPPTVSASNAFTYIPTDCIISVPTGALSAYTSATNYPSSSTYTYIEEN